MLVLIPITKQNLHEASFVSGLVVAMRHQGGKRLCFKHHSILAALRAQPFDLEKILFSKPTLLCLFGFASPQVGFVQSSWILFVDSPFMHFHFPPRFKPPQLLQLNSSMLQTLVHIL